MQPKYLFCRIVTACLTGSCLLALPAHCATVTPPADTRSASAQQSDWQPLLDQQLSHWDRYLSFRHQQGYDGTPPKDANGQLIAPIGLNPPNDNVFQVVPGPDGPELRISGEIYGALTSKQSYQNYHLRLQFRWGERKWPPRQQLLKDSGILYHAIGAHGQEYFRSWMLSQEFQIMQGHLGDYWSQASSAIDVRAYPSESLKSAAADASQPFISVGQGADWPGYVMRSVNRERPAGQWNSLELICVDGQSLHIVNGEVVMVLRNSRYIDDQGQVQPLIAGKIQLQSEAAEVFFRQIEIRPLNALPAAYQALF